MQRKRGEARRRQIVDVAMRILAARGARRFTAQALASEIGVTPAAIFRHYATMDAIAEALVTRVEEALAADLPRDVADPLERLHLFFRRRVRTIAAQPHLSRMLLSDHLAQIGGRRRTARVEALKARSQAFVRSCLKEAERRGQLRRDASPAAGSVLVIGAIFALAHASTRVLTGRRVTRLPDLVWATIETALVAAPARPVATPSRTA